MPMDGRVSMADSALVALGAAIEEALAGRSQAWLAGELGTDGATVSRIIQGQVKNLQLDRVRQIEVALGLPRGALLRAGGYVDGDTSVEAAILGDAVLNNEAKQSLLAVYRSLVDLSLRMPS